MGEYEILKIYLILLIRSFYSIQINQSKLLLDTNFYLFPLILKKISDFPNRYRIPNFSSKFRRRCTLYKEHLPIYKQN